MAAKSESEVVGKRRVTCMLDEVDIVELEAIAQSKRVSLAWVIRDSVRIYLAEQAPLLRQAHSDRRGV